MIHTNQTLNLQALTQSASSYFSLLYPKNIASNDFHEPDFLDIKKRYLHLYEITKHQFIHLQKTLTQDPIKGIFPLILALLKGFLDSHLVESQTLHQLSDTFLEKYLNEKDPLTGLKKAKEWLFFELNIDKPLPSCQSVADELADILSLFLLKKENDKILWCSNELLAPSQFSIFLTQKLIHLKKTLLIHSEFDIFAEESP